MSVTSCLNTDTQWNSMETRDVQENLWYYMQDLVQPSNLAAVLMQFARNRWSAKHGLVRD